MNTRAPKTRISTLAAVSFFCAAWLSAGCSDTQANASAQTREAATSALSVVDLPLAASRIDLLQLAFDAASAMPLQPHAKNRARAQATVVDACFELDQPRRALAYAQQIGDWRRGTGLADFAFYCAEHGDVSEAQTYLDLALQQATSATAAEDQGWRVDRIRAKVARTQVRLGQVEQAEKTAQNLTESERGTLAAQEALKLEPSAIEEQLAALDAAVAAGNFDLMRGHLDACAALFDRCFADLALRERIEQKIKASWQKLPLLVRIECLERLAGFALDHEDTLEARGLIDDARAFLDSAKWTLEDQVALSARLAGLRLRAGDAAKARSEADQALAIYDAQRTAIVDIYRAQALRPLAEVYHALGDHDATQALYRKAVEAGVANPNSRSRADDLTATCLSMARCGFEPDETLRKRMGEIYAALGAPW